MSILRTLGLGILSGVVVSVFAPHAQAQLERQSADLLYVFDGFSDVVAGSATGQPWGGIQLPGELYRIWGKEELVDDGAGKFVDWWAESYIDFRSPDPDPIRFSHTISAYSGYHIEVSYWPDVSVDLETGGTVTASYENIGADATCHVSMEFVGSPFYPVTHGGGAVCVDWITPANVTGSICVSGDGTTVWVNGTPSQSPGYEFDFDCPTGTQVTVTYHSEVSCELGGGILPGGASPADLWGGVITVLELR